MLHDFVDLAFPIGLWCNFQDLISYGRKIVATMVFPDKLPKHVESILIRWKQLAEKQPNYTNHIRVNRTVRGVSPDESMDVVVFG